MGCEMVNKNWTCEEALAANEAALLKDLARSTSDPTLPLFQWAALHELDECEKYYAQDSCWLMTAIRKCANHDLPLPEWAAKAYIKAYDTVNNARAKSWSAVFGNPFPKGRHLSAIRKRRMYTLAVWQEVERILVAKPSTPIDEGLFETVGKKFNIGKTLASEYYYAMKKSKGQE